MSAEAVPITDLTNAALERRVGVPGGREKSFYIGLACALLLHSTLLIGIGRSATRHLGEPDGSNETMTVSLITEADFISQNSVPAQAGQGPGPEAAMPAPAVSESPPLPPPVPPVEAQQPAETPPTPPPPEAPAEQPKKAEAAPTDTPTLESDDLPGLLSMQKQPVEKPSKPPPEPQKDAVEETSQPEQKSETKRPAKTPSKPKQQRTAKLDLSPPPQTFSAPQAGGGRSASFSRPPGITRSGWNDDFARGVIRALQQTMPQLREILGRVTVRILLTENGNVRDVQLVRPSSNSSLDQSVIFAARQTSYPLPPAGATVADRTFVVTYVYR